MSYFSRPQLARLVRNFSGVPGVLVAAALFLGSSSAAGLTSEPGAASVSADRRGRLVVLGFDGADGRTADALMDAGELPNLAKLRESGTFAPLGVVSPPESPVSWAALNTGQNPGKTGVPGFVKRDFYNGQPTPGFGHLIQEEVAIEDLEGTPIPTWSPDVLGAVAAGAVFLLFLVLFAGLLRLRKGVSILLALILGGVGFFAGRTVRGFLPDTISRFGNPNQATNFWDAAAVAGVDCIVLDAAQAFDQKAPERARVLSGLGLPDARGGIGDWFIYTTDDLEFDRAPGGRGTGTAGTVFRVDWRDGKIQSQIYGPTNFWKEGQLTSEIAGLTEELDDPTLGFTAAHELQSEVTTKEAELQAVREERLSVELIAERGSDNSADITIAGQTQHLAEGEWSDFYQLTFEVNRLISVKAVTRVKLLACNDSLFKLFVNTIDIDPAAPPFWQPITSPPGFSRELATMHGGPFETYGWPTLTMPVKDREIGPVTMLEDVEFTMDWREDLTYSTMERDDWRCLFSVFSTTDRVQHMMYQYYDPEHPSYDAEASAQTMTFFGKTIRMDEAIPEIYRQMDRIVGEVLSRMAPEDTLMVCSDHGFQSFRRQVHLNNWLEANGFLVVKSDLTKADGDTLGFVDWSETRAYSLGLGFIYVNLEGREKNGIVKPEEVPALLADIRAKLLASRDGANGIASDAYVVNDIHSGPFTEKEADMIAGFKPPYRVSWRSTMGSMALAKQADGSYAPGPIYTDNTSPWSGGHVSMDVESVRGVFFSNRKVEVPADGGVHSLHIAPTSLAVLGVAESAAMDLKALNFLD